jgi:hypothetical protein
MFGNWLRRRSARPALKHPGVRPGLEILEGRCVPAVFNVAAGDGPGLVAVLNTANINGEADTVNLAPGATYTLTAPGPLGGVAGLTVLDDGGQLLTLNGNGATITRAAGAAAFRILYVNTGAFATLSGLTLTNGNAPSFSGGGIFSFGTLTLSNSTLSGNSAVNGGGIDNEGTLTLISSTFSDNRASESGGGILNVGELTLVGSTLSGNSTAFEGGGIFSNHTLTLTNCTLSGNRANESGGGIYNVGSATVTNATITANRADADFDGKGQGGGIYSPAGTLRLRNTIVAGNFHGAASARDDVNGVVGPSAFNLVGEGTGLIGISNNDANGNMVGTAQAPLDPRLGPLRDNGGPTKTHALLPGSPAIDRGLAPGLAPATDQRGVGRHGPPDIGAFELTAPPPGQVQPPSAQALQAAVQLIRAFQPAGGHLAAGGFADFNADFTSDIALAFRLKNGRLLVVTFDGADGHVLGAFVPFPAKVKVGARVQLLTADLNGDGAPEVVLLVVGGGPGVPGVSAFSPTGRRVL